MLGPSGALTLCLLVLAFLASIGGLLRWQRWIARLPLVVLAFVAAATCGISFVNRYYGYYDSWGALASDLRADNGASALPVTFGPKEPSASAGSGQHAGSHLAAGSAAALPWSGWPSGPGSGSASADPADLVGPPLKGAWSLHKIYLPGPTSGLHGRTGLVLLPPGYSTDDSSNGHSRSGAGASPRSSTGSEAASRPSAKTASSPTGSPTASPTGAPTAPPKVDRLPVVELLHGEPGNPTSWTTGLHIAKVLRYLGEQGRIGREVIVLPDVHGAPGQECLDDPHGLRLTTWLTVDVPRDLRKQLRVAPPGPQWTLGGLSEGAYCAVSLALEHPGRWGNVAVMDAFFHPNLTRSQQRRYFQGSQAAALRVDPTWQLTHTPSDAPLPHFWIMGGTRNNDDYHGAVRFGKLLFQREAFQFVTVLNGNHTTPAWRVALPDLLTWSWESSQGRSLTRNVQLHL